MSKKNDGELKYYYTFSTAVFGENENSEELEQIDIQKLPEDFKKYMFMSAMSDVIGRYYPEQLAQFILNYKEIVDNK